MMQEVIQSIVAVGGFGYLNYWIAARVSDIDLGNDQDKKYLIAFLTSLNYTFYLIISLVLRGVVERTIITILVSILFSLLFPSILKIFYKFINVIRGSSQHSRLEPMLVKNAMFNDDKDRCFIFDFEGNLISSGAMGMLSGKNEELSMKLYPYFASHEEHKIRNEETLYQFLEEKNLEARVYLNFEKKIKIIYF
ncbi:hypothetical protein ACER2P_08125 [Streptococcus pyogenes]|uniref:hypothetical protein n=1 Tax=Streptococcus pyogenes TaxID=1314 RepID=UPI0035A5BA94